MIKRFFSLYTEGFKNMTWGRQLWIIILIKLIIMFAVLKIFFFPNFLNTTFESDEERAEHVLEQLVK